MNLKPEIVDKPNAEKLKVESGGVTFRNVSFSYDHKQPVIKAINLEITAGTKVALVGESGEGKTTLTNLLTAFIRT